MFAVVNLSRHLGVDPEGALAGANFKFEMRFREMERQIKENGDEMRELSLADLEKEWRAAKKRLS